MEMLLLAAILKHLQRQEKVSMYLEQMYSPTPKQL